MYLGDFAEDGDLFFKFTTRAFATGVPATLAGSPVLSVYKDEGGAGTEKTTAETYFDIDVDHDSIAGWHNVRIDLSGDAFFATGADYSVVITTGTVGGVNVFGENLANFSIENRSMGQPAGATLAADIAAVKAETALIVADTGTDGVVLAADAITAAKIADNAIATEHIATAAITADSLGADAITAAKVAADVHTEGANAVWDDAMVETTGAPAITGTFRAAIEWMFALSRNKVLQTATTTTLRNDADAADLATSTVSDDATTYTRGEWST